jgi:hypothetical protein
MSGSYQIPSRRGPLTRLIGGVDEFMQWMLYGYETWLVALLKGVPLFLFVYFVIFYVPNYIYYAVTLYILDFSRYVGFLVANGVGAGNFVLLIVLALWTQAARGRQGFGWSLVRFLDFFQYVGTVLVIIPWMVFNLAGGSIWPWVPPTFFALALGAISVAMGAASLAYLYVEYRRITRREAAAATTAGRAWSAGNS